MNTFKKFVSAIVPAAAFLLPWTAFAATTFSEWVDEVVGVINAASALVVSLFFFAFVFGFVRFLYAQGKGDDKGVETGKKFMIWGVVAAFVIVSFVSLANLITINVLG